MMLPGTGHNERAYRYSGNSAEFGHARCWRKASRSSKDDNCVEVGRVGDGAAVRDTKNRAAGYFTTTGPQWSAFLTALKHGRYDR